MRRTTRLLLLLLLLVSVFYVKARMDRVTAGTIEPRLKACSLRIGGKTLRPVQVASPWRMEYVVGPDRLFVDEDGVEKPSCRAGMKTWIARSDDGRRLHWLAASSNTAYLLGYDVDEDGDFRDYESPPRLRRLDLTGGTWRADLPLAGEGSNRTVAAVAVDGPDVVVLSSLAGTASNGWNVVTGYVVRCHRGDDETPRWSRTFPCEGERGYAGAYLWGVPQPPHAASHIQQITWMGDRLLICAEALQPLLCLNRDTGSELWRQERIWEFQRGFVGPSVWSHFIARFASDRGANDTNEQETIRKDFDQRYSCALVGGPVVVPLRFERGDDTHSIFVAVSKGPAATWSGFLSDCLIYELNSAGIPIAMATLPQMLQGDEHCVTGDAVTWRGQNNTLVQIRPAAAAPVMSMGGGGADGLARVAWLRQATHEEAPAWLSSGLAWDGVAFGDTHAFCLPAGGFVVREGDSVFHFPLTAIDLGTGLDRELELRVPFRGSLDAPGNNYSRRTLADGSESYRTRLFHKLAVTGLKVRGHELEVVLGMEGRAMSVTFDLTGVLAVPRVAETPRPSASLRASLIAWFKGGASRDEQLCSAAHGADVGLLKALLKSGADPKHVSEHGWTALMSAAVYGSGEMVEALIEAGSDVNAADRNCGGQTVLMWAARGREAKRKVRALLQAGADPSVTLEGGAGVLHFAAGSGEIEVVELLLQAGLPVDQRARRGQTVLMEAATSGNAELIRALLAAGSQPDDTDEQGRTALMYAAEHGRAAVVRALLEVGADPVTQDRAGRTALQWTEKAREPGRTETADAIRRAVPRPAPLP